MNKKKILVITLALISLASIVFIFLVTKKGADTSKPKVGEPALEQKYKGKYTINLSISEDQFNFPKQLPLIEVVSDSTSITEEQAKNIALKLGFLGDPTTINDSIDGTSYFWKKDSSILFVYARSGKIRYETGSFSPGVNKQLSDSEIVSYAQQFISEKNIYSGTPFQMGKFKYLKEIPNGEGFQEGSKQSAVLYQISILPQGSDYEFISASSVESSSFIQLKQDGSVYALQATMFPSIQTSTIEYKLKNFNEVKSSLNEAVLIELRGNAQLLSDMPTDLIETIKINNIEIAYLIESTGSTVFQPVYKLVGEATLSNSQDKYVATLYLPAILK